MLVDAFLIPGMMRQKREELRHRVMTELMALGTGAAVATVPMAPAAHPASPQIVSPQS